MTEEQKMRIEFLKLKNQISRIVAYLEGQISDAKERKEFTQWIG